MTWDDSGIAIPHNYKNIVTIYLHYSMKLSVGQD